MKKENESLEIKIARLDEKVGFVLQEIKDLREGIFNDVEMLKRDKADRRDVEVLQKKINDDMETRMRLLESSVVDRNYYDEKHQILQKQIDDLNISSAVLNAKASTTSVWIAYAISIATFLISIFLKK